MFARVNSTVPLPSRRVLVMIHGFDAANGRTRIPDQELRGRLATGVGQGKHFSRLDWVRRQFVDKLGIDPFPGTVNLVVGDPESMRIWNRLKRTPGVRIENPGTGPHACHARCYPVSIESRIDAAIVLPEITGYSPVLIEIIAAVEVRAALDLEDGDSLALTIKLIAAATPP